MKVQPRLYNPRKSPVQREFTPSADLVFKMKQTSVEAKQVDQEKTKIASPKIASRSPKKEKKIETINLKI